MNALTVGNDNWSCGGRHIKELDDTVSTEHAHTHVCANARPLPLFCLFRSWLPFSNCRYYAYFQINILIPLYITLPLCQCLGTQWIILGHILYFKNT